jgi:hypothetical protein
MRISLLLFFLVISQVSIGQRRVRVPEGFGTLNEVIRTDTVANGARRDVNTIYVLKRGGVYVLSGTVLATGFTLRLEAEDGDGPRPYVLMGFLTGGTQVEECFSVFNGARFSSIHFSAIDEVNTYVARVVSVDAPNSKIEFFDCIVDGSGQTLMRLNSSGAKIYMHNCTVSRMGRPSNPDNGRVIDDRGNQVDSLVIENNTWYNITSRVIRDGGAEINYVNINQNTFANVGQRFAAIGAVNKFYFNNNIVVNPRYEGNSTTSTTVSLEFSLVGENPIVNLDYNNIYYDQAILSAWATLSTGGNVRLAPPFVSPANQSTFTNSLGIIQSPINFTNAPVPPTEILLVSGQSSGSTVPDWDMSGALDVLPWQLNEISYHNFSYPTSEPSYVGSTSGEPLGDLRWFNGFEINSNLQRLINYALSVVTDFQQNGSVISANDAFLNVLQTEVSESMLALGNPTVKRAVVGSAYSELQQALENFKNSFIVTAVEETQKEDIRIFPNPCINYVYVPNHDAKIDLMTIYDVNGKSILIKNLTRGLHTEDVQHLAPGLYVVAFYKSNQLVNQLKFIKK